MVDEKYVTHREYEAAFKSLRKWIIAELKLRDRAVELANDENKANMTHLNDLRQGVVTQETFKTFVDRIETLEGFRNKSIGVIMSITALSGVLGGVIGYTITQVLVG